MFNLHLPTIEIIAGDTCPFVFDVQDSTHINVASSNCTAYFSISTYVNEGSDPVVSVSQSNISTGSLIFELAPSDTIDLHGKYVYQLYLSNGESSEVYGGHLIVYENRNKTVVTE